MVKKMPRGYRWCKGQGRGGRGRPCDYRKISQLPKARGFTPTTNFNRNAKNPPIFFELDELEAMRLVDGENLTQEDAGEKMGISRGSIWRLLQSGRKKIITAIYENREIRIPFDPGKLEVAET